MELTYHEGTDGMLYPDLKMKEQEDYELGKYGNLRWNYLKTKKRALFQILLMKDELWEHLVDVDKRGLAMEEQIVNQMARQNGVDEQMKADHQMDWVQQMNSFTQSAQEVVMNDLIYQ